MIRAGDIGAGKGEVFVLDMGEPVKIVDLAHNMIRLAGYEPETRHRGRVHPAAARGEAARGALRRGREAAADGGAADQPRGPRDAARPRVGRVDAELARTPGDGRRRGQSGRAGGRADRRAGWRRGGGRLRRIASRSHFAAADRTNRRLRRPGRVPRPRRPRPALVHPGPRHPPPARVGRLGARARRRAQGGDLDDRRPAGRGAARSWRRRARPSTRRSSQREERRQRREAGLPELTRARAPARALLRLRRRASPSRATWSRSSSSSCWSSAASPTRSLSGSDDSAGGKERQAGRGEGASRAKSRSTVLNGTAVPGLAATYGDKVEGKGFQLGAVTNSSTSFADSVVMFKRGHAPEARTGRQAAGDLARCS